MADMNKKSISVNSSLSSGTVRSRITVSRDLEKYLNHPDFWSRYDEEIIPTSSLRRNSSPIDRATLRLGYWLGRLRR